MWVLKSALQFEYAYIFGAACPAKDKALGLVLPLANMATTCNSCF
jgi:hypothetical protein